MQFKLPKNDYQIIWTRHVISKMRQYGFSEAQLRRLLKNYDRRELGIAPETIAVSCRTGTKKHPTEAWLMYQNVGKQIKIITAWRYPAISPKRDRIPIPDEIIRELKYEKN